MPQLLPTGEGLLKNASHHNLSAYVRIETLLYFIKLELLQTGAADSILLLRLVISMDSWVDLHGRLDEQLDDVLLLGRNGLVHQVNPLFGVRSDPKSAQCTKK